MKTIRTQIVFAGAMLLFALMMNVCLAQPSPPSPPAHGEEENKGNAPIDGGLGIALAMVAGYGAWKLIKKRNNRTLE